MLVVDATVAIDASQFVDGFQRFHGNDLVAPPLMWSEARSVLHEMVWRGFISRETGLAALESLERAPIASRAPRHLGREAWRVADEMGWAKTYDAEYIALASLLKCRLVTLDERLLRRTRQLGFVLGVSDV